MKDMSVRNKGNKLSLRSKILLGALALAVVAVLGSAMQAVQSDTANKAGGALFGWMNFFDPFTLRTVEYVAQSDSGTVALDEPIRISSRPSARTPSRPSWVPPRGKPPWWPPPK